MALLFMDSFDHYATADLPGKWPTLSSAPTINAGSGRRASNSLRTSSSSNAQTGVLPVSGTTVIVGVALKIVTLGTTAPRGVLSVRSTVGTQCSLVVTLTGLLQVFRGDSGGTLLGSTSVTLSVGTYYFIELKAAVVTAGGTVDVQVNGANVLSLTGQNTANTGSSGWTSVRIGPDNSNAHSCDFDDCYILDGSGSAPLNTFLGDCRVDARYPTGAGATTAWTPSAGANWAAVDETAPNGDTDYVATLTTGLTDTYVVQDVPVVGATIYGVQQCLSLKKGDAGACTVAPVIRHAGADNVGADLVPGVSYAYGLQMAAVNPGTGAAWTEAGFNAAEFGFKKTT